MKCLNVLLIVCAGTVMGIGQVPTPTPQAVDQNAAIGALQAQIDVLTKQREFEKAESDLQQQRLQILLNAVKNDAKPPPNQTTFKPEEKAGAEVSALSYEALNELSDQIVRQIAPVTGRYSAIVIYNEPDFQNLAKYRLYRYQTELALADYKRLKADLELAAAKMGPIDCDLPGNAADLRCRKGTRTFGLTGLQSVVSAPAIATGLVGSVADLLAMFRSETIITPSRDTVDESALSTAMGSALLTNNRQITIFIPGAFVPEYDLMSEGTDSILVRVTDVNLAYADVCHFLEETQDLTPAEKKSLQDIINRGEAIRDTLQGLSIFGQKIGGQTRAVATPVGAPAPPPSGGSSQRGGEDNNAQAYSDLRGLIRAEKLERFLRQGAKTIGDPAGPKVGILKVHGLSSGGSRRETRNLIFGNKIRYSGALTFEVQMFDVDGTLRSSDIFSGYTGFQKFEPTKKRP